MWNLIDIINLKTMLFVDNFKNIFCYQSINKFIALVRIMVTLVLIQ